MKSKSRIAGKLFQLDYDELWLMDDCEKCYSLSNREVAMIIGQTDYFAWKTRYKQGALEIEQDVIDGWMSNLQRKLMSGCCPDDVTVKIYRLSPEGVWQVQDPESGLWTDAPDDDPRRTAPQSPPLPGDNGSPKKCAGADNVRDIFTDWRNNLIAILGGGTLLSAVIAALIGFIGAWLSLSVAGTAIGVFLLSLAAAIFDAGNEGVEAEITDEALEDFKCILYCNIQDDGTFSDSDVQSILFDIATQFDGLAETFFYQTVASLGARGLTNMASAGRSTADDCDECECEDCGCPDEDRVNFVYGANQVTYDPAPDESGFDPPTYYATWNSPPVAVEMTLPESHCFNRLDFIGYLSITLENPSHLKITCEGEEVVVPMPSVGSGTLYDVHVDFGQFHSTDTFTWEFLWTPSPGDGKAQFRQVRVWYCPEE